MWLGLSFCDVDGFVLSYSVCPKCQSEMRWSHHFGVLKDAKSGFFGGLMFDQAKICSKCGYVEFYLDSNSLKKLRDEPQLD